MTIVKKLKEEWNPVEHPHLKVGDVVAFAGETDLLVREGNIMLVEEEIKKLESKFYDKKCKDCGKAYQTEQPASWYCAECKSNRADGKHKTKGFVISGKSSKATDSETTMGDSLTN